ncbi:hypothetical protein Tco_0587405, partial [Tanacetum coccineum]
VEDEQDVIHDSNSSDVVLSAELGNLEYTILSTNDESTEVDALPDNEVADEEGADFIGDEDDVVPSSLHAVRRPRAWILVVAPFCIPNHRI